MRQSVESLERRTLLSAYFKQTPGSNVLRAFGTAGDDHVIITVTYEPVVVNDDPAASHNDYWFRIALSDAPDSNGLTFLRGSIRTLRLYLGSGNDTVEVRGSDTASAAKFDARMLVDAGSGNDTVTTGSGDDQIDGGSGADVIQAGLGNDTIIGGGGNDRIRTGGGDGKHVESVSAGQGDDRIYSADVGITDIRGNAGNDTLFNGAGRDSFVGGAGNDVVDYSARHDNVYIDLSASDGAGETLNLYLGQNQPRRRNNGLFDDGRSEANEPTEAFSDKTLKSYLVPPIDHFAGIGPSEQDSVLEVENAVGGSGDDVLIGSSHANALRGGAGKDSIFAGGGPDDVFGDAGDDQIFAADSRDGSGVIFDGGRFPAKDIIDGGGGNDFARIDVRDTPTGVESVERLRPLVS